VRSTRIKRIARRVLAIPQAPPWPDDRAYDPTPPRITLRGGAFLCGRNDKRPSSVCRNMNDTARLIIIRHHVGKAQAILAEFIDPKSGAEGPVAMKRLVNRLKHHLDHRELVSALSVSDGEQKIEQADAKSIHKAKKHQAA
jgi:hypothetical protein